jgi:hypothetical protein
MSGPLPYTTVDVQPYVQYDSTHQNGHLSGNFSTPQMPPPVMMPQQFYRPLIQTSFPPLPPYQQGYQPVDGPSSYVVTPTTGGSAQYLSGNWQSNSWEDDLTDGYQEQDYNNMEVSLVSLPMHSKRTRATSSDE